MILDFNISHLQKGFQLGTYDKNPESKREGADKFNRRDSEGDRNKKKVPATLARDRGPELNDGLSRKLNGEDQFTPQKRFRAYLICQNTRIILMQIKPLFRKNQGFFGKVIQVLNFETKKRTRLDQGLHALDFCGPAFAQV